MLFVLGHMNFKMLLLKKPTLSELRVSGSRLFHSFVVEWKEQFLKKLFRTNFGNIVSFLSNIWYLMKGLIGKDKLVTCLSFYSKEFPGFATTFSDSSWLNLWFNLRISSSIKSFFSVSLLWSDSTIPISSLLFNLSKQKLLQCMTLGNNDDCQMRLQKVEKLERVISSNNNTSVYLDDLKRQTSLARHLYSFSGTFW